MEESGEDGDPGPHSSFKLVSKVAIPARSIVIETVQAQKPYDYRDRTGRVNRGKPGDTRVHVLSEQGEAACHIPWLERGWRSKRLSNNFMKALHYGQRLEQAIRMRNGSLSPEVIDRELVRRVV
jgi:hypothetical protein